MLPRRPRWTQGGDQETCDGCIRPPKGRSCICGVSDAHGADRLADRPYNLAVGIVLYGPPPPWPRGCRIWDALSQSVPAHRPTMACSPHAVSRASFALPRASRPIPPPRGSPARAARCPATMRRPHAPPLSAPSRSVLRWSTGWGRTAPRSGLASRTCLGCLGGGQLWRAVRAGQVVVGRSGPKQVAFSASSRGHGNGVF